MSSPYRHPPKQPPPVPIWSASEKRWALAGALLFLAIFAVCWRTGCMVYD